MLLSSCEGEDAVAGKATFEGRYRPRKSLTKLVLICACAGAARHTAASITSRTIEILETFIENSLKNSPGRLLIPQGFNRIQGRSFMGRIVAEKDADHCREAEGNENRQCRDERRPVQNSRNHDGESAADDDANEAAHQT